LRGAGDQVVLAIVAPREESSGRPGFWRRVDSPRFVVLIAALLYMAFLVARIERRHGDASSFVTAGDLLVDGNAPKSLTILKASKGYDGEFYYRLALDPFTSERTAFGITFDSPRYRQQRILYPLITWTLSLGRPEAVPWVLIAVNYAALCTIAWLGGTYARRAGRHSLWGLAFPLYAGFLLTLSRDLTEIVEACCLLAAVHSVQRGRQWWGAGFLALAILAKETAVLVAAGALLAWLASRKRPSVQIEPQLFLVPFAVFAVWQGWLMWAWGAGPGKEIQSNVGLPLASFGPFVAEVFGATGPFRLKAAIEVFLILVLLGSAAIALRSSRGMRLAKASWLLYAALVLSLTRSVWCEDWAFLRAFSECYLLGAMILLSAAHAVRVPAISLWLAGWLALALNTLKH
jgi:hypothetical protein